jgi:LmbE family N-acetylglucosaminyl deacetylase
MENNGRILAVGAHPDDVEFLCAGTLTILKQKGYAITIATMTPGDCGSVEHSAEEIARIRRGEAAAAAAVIGARYVCLEERDFAIDYDTATRRKVVSLVREANPFIVITHALQDYMTDHEITGRLMRDACFGAPIPNYGGAGNEKATHSIPYLYYCDPIEGVDYYGNRVSAQFIVDISSVIETKTQMLACHDSQRSWLRRQHGMDQYIEHMLEWGRQRGQEAGVAYGEGFTQHRGHPYPQENRLLALVS